LEGREGEIGEEREGETGEKWVDRRGARSRGVGGRGREAVDDPKNSTRWIWVRKREKI
jgi:hypothetical protein